MNIIELGKEGQVIEWREHMFSGLMKEMREEEMAHEPVLHTAENWASRQLTGVRIDQDGMRWDWGVWEKVVITVYSRGRSVTETSRVAGESSFIAWNAFLSSSDAWQGAYFDCLELTPWDRLNDAGVTVRIERPTVVDTGAVSFRFMQQRYWKSVRVRLEKPDSRWQEVGVWRLQYGGDGYVLSGQELRFNSGEGPGEEPGESVDAPVKGFRGVVAVVGVTETNERRLIACRWFTDWDNSLDDITDEGTARAVCDLFEGDTDSIEGNEPVELTAWLNQWPHCSRERLRQAYRKSLGLSSISQRTAWQMIKQNPTGVQRALMLRLAGLLGDKSFDQLADELKDGDFLRALQRLLPTLPDRFSRDSPSAQRWMIERLGAENFVRTIDLAGDGDLELAWKLNQPLNELREIVDSLRPGIYIHDQANALLRDLEQAPQRGGDPAALDARVQALKTQIAQDSQQPVDPEARPPLTRILYENWRQKSERMKLWRRNLAQVLAHCEIGTWELPDQAPSHQELKRRLEKIKAPTLTPGPEPDAQSGALVQTLIEELLAEYQDEPRIELREIAWDKLETVIKPHADVWGPLHTELEPPSP